jgi:transposase InsO family protein
MTSCQMIGILKKHFARFGIPSTVMSDNGPQFVSREFELFLSNWKVNHATSSPGNNLRLSDNCDLLFRKYQV